MTDDSPGEGPSTDTGDICCKERSLHPRKEEGNP